ncbi:hypothetical protein BGZ97_007221 [Linnemannia gamsii]|uniref:Uncharacterized protein n=1 Tax=Linnemannia gamsii TaxID=64522 RepID=A0A9P6RFH0_9FUNG|nr:hypothetical protein BGZ97_007221 [Linnemannia gamsii]
MPSDRPSIEPISTNNSSPAAQQHPRPEIATKSLPSRIVPGLPSPPLSPLQFHSHGSHGNVKRLSMLSFPSVSSQPLTPLPEDSTPTTTSFDNKEATQRFEGGYLSGEGEEVDSSVPMLPSQLRRRHENMRRQRSASMQARPSSRSGESTAVNYGRHSMTTVEFPNDNHYHTIINASHTKSIMESTPGSSLRMLASQGHCSDIVPMSHSNNGTVGMTVTSGPEMPTRDWVKMQCKIQALETEVSHVSRTNSLLNQELDKVTAHLSRLLNSETDDEQQQGGQSVVAGTGPVGSWRREYEFLVQQVDLMHRQLQLAQSEQHARARFGGLEIVSARSEDRSEVTQQLYSEVKDLTASLKMWQTAFQQADEKYRRKCDGERVLKETLRDRETQLTTLVDKLSGCESEFRKSISNYDEMMRLSAKIEVLESQRHASESTTPKVSLLALESSQDTISVSAATPATTTATIDDGEMPGSFPEVNRGQTRRRSNTLPSNMASPAAVEQVSVSILSWATLLATYMLS